MRDVPGGIRCGMSVATGGGLVVVVATVWNTTERRPVACHTLLAVWVVGQVRTANMLKVSPKSLEARSPDRADYLH